MFPRVFLTTITALSLVSTARSVFLPSFNIRAGQYHITSFEDGYTYFVEGPVEGPLIVGPPTKIGPQVTWDVTQVQGDLFTFKSRTMGDHISITNVDRQLFSETGETKFKFLPAIVSFGSTRILLAEEPELVWELGQYNQTSGSHMVFLRKIDLLNKKQLWLFKESS